MTSLDQHSSNIVLSAPAGTDNVRTWMFTTLFNPPQNVKGKRCKLKVYNVGVQRTSATYIDQLSTYSLSLSFTQPYGYQSLNYVSGYDGQSVQAPAATATATSNTGATTIVALVGTGGLVTSTTFQNFFGSDYPEIIVNVPDGSHDCTVRLQKIGGAVDTVMSVGLEQLTVGFTLTPVE